MAPVSAFTRRFWPVFETMRSLSAAGLKSTPYTVPVRAVVKVTPTAVAAPEAGSTVYSRLLLATPYSLRVAVPR